VRCARTALFYSREDLLSPVSGAQSSIACDCPRSHIQVVFADDLELVFAAYRMPAGRWSIVAPCCRDLSGRTGVRRIAVLDEPAVDGSEVIKLEEARRDRLAARPAGYWEHPPGV